MGLKKKTSIESENIAVEMQTADHEELPQEEVSEDIATKRLNNAVSVVKAIFHLNDEYVVTSFKDTGKSIDLTLNNPDFTISVKIKDTSMYGID